MVKPRNEVHGPMCRCESQLHIIIALVWLGRPQKSLPWGLRAQLHICDMKTQVELSPWTLYAIRQYSTKMMIAEFPAAERSRLKMFPVATEQRPVYASLGLSDHVRVGRDAPGTLGASLFNQWWVNGPLAKSVVLHVSSCRNSAGAVNTSVTCAAAHCSDPKA